MRRPIVAGNWKMNLTAKEASLLIENLLSGLKENTETGLMEIVVCPAFTALQTVAEKTKDTEIVLGAQNMHWERSGAYTGEVSPAMLVDLGCKYVIIGHSERRQYFAETDEVVNKKVKAALASNLGPIMCVGESLEERESDLTEKVIREQLLGGLKGIQSEDFENVVVAYEPVWAIGSGKAATAEDAEKVALLIRNILRELAGEVSERVRIQYGGSVKASNIGSFMAQPNIDGALVGGASLEGKGFAELIGNAK